MRGENVNRRLLEIVRIGGYLIVGGALLGFSAGMYFLFNRSLFTFLVRIGQFEVTSYFLSVFMPSFIILIIIGYLFATTLAFRTAELSRIAPLCGFSLLCIVLSALSILYFVSLIGGFLVLTALMRVYAKPTFTMLSKREAFFMLETGALFLSCFSATFLTMWLVSNVFQTYSIGFIGTYSPIALLMVGVLSLLIFFGIPLWGSRGTNAGFSGVFGLIMTIVSYWFVIQNHYSLSNATIYVGMFMMLTGFFSALIGSLAYVWLVFMEPSERQFVAPALLSEGKYCPYCGKPRKTAVQNLCSNCGRSLMWAPFAPFCSSCGFVVPANVQACPHCGENLQSKRALYQEIYAEEDLIADRLMTESAKEKSWIIRSLLKASWPVTRVLKVVYWFFEALARRMSLSMKKAVLIVILTYLIGFISFISYARVEATEWLHARVLLLNYGYPLEWLQLKYDPYPEPYVIDVAVGWIPLALDLALYFFISMAIVYGAAKLKLKR